MSRKMLAALLLLISVATTYRTQTESEWFRFTSPEGLFSLLLPHEPKFETGTDPTTEKRTHQRFNQFEKGYGFVIDYFEDISTTDAEKYLDGTSAGIKETIKGTLINESKISLDGYPGRDLTLSVSAKNGTAFFSRTKVYLVDTSLFSISYIWRQDIDAGLASKIGEKCFSSLKIKPRQ